MNNAELAVHVFHAHRDIPSDMQEALDRIAREVPQPGDLDVLRLLSIRCCSVEHTLH